MNYPDSAFGEGVGPDLLAIGKVDDTATRDPFFPPRLGDTPPFPQPGIYFDMPEETYHSIPALSNSGTKKLAASPMLFWESSWMNPNNLVFEDEKEKNGDEPEKQHNIYGKAYHCRLMEGREAFYSRYMPRIVKPANVDFVESTDQIKAAIQATEFRFTNAETGETEVRKHDWLRKVPLEGGPDGAMRAARKDDWLKQLLEINPEARVWEHEKALIQEQNAGKVELSHRFLHNLEVSARVLESDPEIAPLFKGGHAEVSLFWYCEETGVPMKARVDYMKVTRMVDLKTFANQRQHSPERAVRFEISGYKYPIQPTIYIEGGRAVRDIVRKEGPKAIHIYGDPTEERRAELQEFVEKWASHVLDDNWTWVFGMKSVPVYRAVDYSEGGDTGRFTRDIVKAAKLAFKKNAEAYGCDPWLDLAPRYMIADEDIPQSATEF